MTIGGWITMAVSLAVVWGGAAWCFRLVFSKLTERDDGGEHP
ncbi:MAG: MetS family NSS transporter small subunit [Acidobacteria bacterium]|nr:MetS family NSS transporter small subunit [Acidobacteriota bacterium]